MASLSLPKSRCRNDLKAATASSRDMPCALCLQCCNVLTDPTLPCDSVAPCPSCRNAAYLCSVKPAKAASRKGPPQCPCTPWRLHHYSRAVRADWPYDRRTSCRDDDCQHRTCAMNCPAGCCLLLAMCCLLVAVGCWLSLLGRCCDYGCGCWLGRI